MDFYTIYVASAIFGAGMMLIDLTGVLSHIGDDGDGEEDFPMDETEVNSPTAHQGADADGEGGDNTSTSEDEGSVLMYKPGKGKSLVLRWIAILKGIVYFALGFGATGWFATNSDYHWSLSLPLSLGMGILTLVIAKLVRRLQRSELNSQISDNQLLMSEAEVLVETGNRKIGKVRIKYEGMNVDRYARALDEQDYFKRGTTVRVMQVADDFVYVGLV